MALENGLKDRTVSSSGDWYRICNTTSLQKGPKKPAAAVREEGRPLSATAAHLLAVLSPNEGLNLSPTFFLYS